VEDARGDQGAARASQTRGARPGFRGFRRGRSRRRGKHGGHRGVRRRCGSSARREGERPRIHVFGSVVQHRGDPEDREGTGRSWRPNAEHWPAFCSNGRLLTVCVASRGQLRRATRKHGGGRESVTVIPFTVPNNFCPRFRRVPVSQQPECFWFGGKLLYCALVGWRFRSGRSLADPIRSGGPDFGPPECHATFADYNRRTRPYKGWELNSGCSSFVCTPLWPSTPSTR